MIQEYLFIDKERQEEVKAYKPKDVVVEYADIEKTSCWIASYSVAGENEDSAAILSDVNEYIQQEFSPTVITNGCSAYFNKSLFPHVNEFERKLRKFLYLKSALNKDDKATANIKDLEKKDLGELFELLFADDMFVNDIKKKIRNDITWKFTKKQIIEIINSVEENTLWDELIGSRAVPKLRSKFYSVIEYRNDVMHAHNVDVNSYRVAQTLFKRINKQLDNEIGLMLTNAKHSSAIGPSDYNTKLSEALQSMDAYSFSGEYRKLYSKAYDSFLPSLQTLQQISAEAALSAPELTKLKEAMQGMQSAWQISPEQMKAVEQLDNLSKSFFSSPDVVQFQQTVENLNREMKQLADMLGEQKSSYLPLIDKPKELLDPSDTEEDKPNG